MSNRISGKNEQMSIFDLLQRLSKLLGKVLKQWWKIALAGVLGAALGLVVAFFMPVTYTGKLSFLVEEGKSSGGGLAAIAGQFGFDLGGLGGSAGLLSADNVLVFLKSVSLARETLLSPYDDSGKVSLADVYARSYNLTDDWIESKKIGQIINFPPGDSLNRIQDSLVQVMVKRITKNDLIIEKPDKKASFVEVMTEMRDERLAKLYCERLVENATKRYVNSKTARQTGNVERLQHRADSLAVLLYKRTYTAAAAQENILDLNPAVKSALVATEVSGRDKLMLSTIYGEVIKNLEISRVALSQETPAIQIVDDVTLPLQRNKAGKLLYMFIGSVVLAFIVTLILVGKMIVRSTAYTDTNHFQNG